MASQSIYAPKVADDADREQQEGATEEEDVPPNPYLTRSLLYLSGVDASISDRDLANSVFQPFVPVRLNINRNGDALEPTRGTVEFQTLEKAEKAFATVRLPQLSIHEDESQDEKPNAKPRLIKQLPHATEDVDVYDIFRPYGPLASARRILTNPQGHHTGFRGMALVVYYSEEDAQRAQSEVHCAEVEGKTISVSIDNVARRPSAQGPGFSPSATPFVPGAMAGFQAMSASAPAFQPPHRSSSGSQSPHIPGNSLAAQQSGHMMAVPGTNLQYSASAATYIDPCNLFCKNLDPNIDSNHLFSLFKDFGKIVSARVMRDEKGASREFGFVSYRRPEDANRALQAMNQTMHGSKQMTVRLHEPKNVRQEKLSHKFGSSYVGALDSPNEGGPSSEANGSSGGSQSPGPNERSRERRGSNSYFRAAASGENGSGSVDMDQLKTMSLSVRGEIVRGEFSRRVKTIKDVDQEHVDGLVSELSKLKLVDAVNALNDPKMLAQRVHEIQARGSSATAQNEGVMSAETERERLLAAVTDLLPVDSPVEDITDLLVGLPKKERAMALFNNEYLRKKVDEAKEILEMAGDDDEGKGSTAFKATTSPLTKENIALASATPATSHQNSQEDQEEGERPKVYTLSDLASMPASEILKLANSSQSAGLPLPKADAAVVKETNDFIDGIQGLAPHDQKQKVGDQLFKKIRTFGIKGAPKITIALLDSEELRSLAHLMNSYPECLREKVLLQTSK